MAEHNAVPIEQLVDWLEGRLSPTEAAEVEQQVHMAGPAVEPEVAWLRAFLRISQEVTLVEPPPSVRQALTERFAAYAQSQRAPTIFERIVAALTFDSGLLPAPVGVRAASARTRQLVFAAPQLDVVLNVEPRSDNERVDLLGQILPTIAGSLPEPFAIQLLQGESEAAIAMSDDLGEFEFSALASGSYQLVISNESMEILLPIFQLNR
jgi:hypothetical protein